jgi:hypothetical protein
MAITVSWLRADPDTRVKLWAAEADRRSLELLTFLEAHQGIASGEVVPSKPGIELKRQIIAEARELASEAGIAGGGANAPLIPPIRKRAEEEGTDATLVAYKLFFGPWSEWAHTGAGSLAVRADGDTAVFEDGPLRDRTQALSLTGALYAYVLAELSRWIGLGIEGQCDELREELVRSDAAAARGD